MTTLPKLPLELNPDYHDPFDDETCTEETVAGRQPRVGEWVNGNAPVTYSDGRMARGGEMVLAQVIEVHQGNYCGPEKPIGGCLVRAWRQTHMSFGEPFFMPWCCIVSRTKVNRYSLTGVWEG